MQRKITPIKVIYNAKKGAVANGFWSANATAPLKLIYKHIFYWFSWAFFSTNFTIYAFII